MTSPIPPAYVPLKNFLERNFLLVKITENRCPVHSGGSNFSIELPQAACARMG